MTEPEFAKEDDVEVPVIESLLVQSLSLLQIDYLRKVQNRLHYVQVKFAEDGMVVVQAEVADVNLDFFTCVLPFPEFLSDLEETFFDFSLNSWLELFFHVVEF